MKDEKLRGAVYIAMKNVTDNMHGDQFTTQNPLGAQ